MQGYNEVQSRDLDLRPRRKYLFAEYHINGEEIIII